MLRRPFGRPFLPEKEHATDCGSTALRITKLPPVGITAVLEC
jgi:hypothetical protein